MTGNPQADGAAYRRGYWTGWVRGALYGLASGAMTASLAVLLARAALGAMG